MTPPIAAAARRLLLAAALAAPLGAARAEDAAAPAAAETAPVAPAAPAAAATRNWRTGLALIGEPKYGAGFARFDYAAPDAPKGGTVRLSSIGSFDTLNPILSKGDPAEGLGLVFEPLMKASDDEISAEYGLLADAVSYPDDYSSVTYRLNPKARWQDGEPVTPDDVVWSFERLKELNPSQGFYYRHVASAAATGEREVTFTFDEKNNRELPNIVGQLLVLPKHWWTGKDAGGRQRSISDTTLEPPPGSGPYRIASVSPGRGLSYERVQDYWGADLPVNVGQNNFDRIDYVYFRDDSVAFEAFKANQFDYWSENRAARWATAYDFPAARDGAVRKERYANPYRSAGLMVGFVPNLRRPTFQDRRVRQALNLAFDFETMQKTLFYGEYERPDSFFFRTELASSGLPGGQELGFLEPLRGKVPDGVFAAPYANPVGGDNAKVRDNFRRALQLLKDAGFEQRGGRMVNVATGAPLAFEILLNGDTIGGVAGQFQGSLKRIGIEATIRAVDPSQYINRVRSRDYDMIYASFPQTLSPGNEQYFFWGSDAADKPASQNYAGIRNPAVDALITNVVQAKDRATLIAATKALDRVLLAEQYVIPSYVTRDERVAIWDRFSHPPELPKYSTGWPNLWWYDAAKAAKVPAPRS